jgi:phosphatidylserine/phosphatidylglycerophosphate/cardiolipin synthase-like enzyme
MILQFPMNDIRSTPGWALLMSETPFGPVEPSGFSKRLILQFDPGLTPDLVAPFDGYLRRIVPVDPESAPAIYELQPHVTAGALRLAEGLSGQIPEGLSGQMPRMRWHNVPEPLDAAIADRINEQVTATDPSQVNLRHEKFESGKVSIFVERGARLAAGVSTVAIEIRTREGVPVDPIAYYSYYLDLPGGADDLLADRGFLEDFFPQLTRRALVQLVDEQGAPLQESVRTHAPDGSTEDVDLAQTGGTLVQADFPTLGPVDLQLEAVTLADPLLDAGEQAADHYVIVNEWPAEPPELPDPIDAGANLEHRIALAEPDRPVYRRFVVTRLRNWLASQQVTDEALQLPRYTSGNRVEALVDGIVTFDKMYDDIKAMPDSGDNRFFYLAGWRLAYLLKLKLDQDDSRFIELMEELVAKDANVRIILWDQFHLDSEALHGTLSVALGAIILLGMAGMNLIPPADTIIWALLGVPMLGIPALVNNEAVQNFVSRQVETNERAVTALADSGIDTFLDGKVRQTRQSGVIPVLYDFVGTHHQKFSVISRPDTAIAYCGGVDIWPDRLDDPGHFSPSPYHDLHTRIEGPAVRDLVRTFRQRWDDQQPGNPADDGTAGAAALSDGRQIVQIARTYPSHLNPANDSYPFAPEGDFTIQETLKQAIGQARRYIYIEDQYMTIPPVLRDIIHERMTAHDELQLIMTLPRVSDQPQNSMRRARIMGTLLQEFGPDRVGIFYLTKVVVPHDPERHGPVMSRLRDDISEDAVTIPLQDASQFSDQGFIMIGSEEIRYNRRDIDTHSLEIDDPHGWRSFNNTQAAAHKRKALVRQVEYRDIFVHPKLWLIDDVFASIGSANTNQRGMTHDGEVTVMLVDGSADRGARRFAKQLRIDLWADHLGLHDSSAARLLLDNIDEAIALFTSNSGPAAKHLRRYWHAWNMTPESWGSFASSTLYWDEVVLDDSLWDTYIDPDGSIPF